MTFPMLALLIAAPIHFQMAPFDAPQASAAPYLAGEEAALAKMEELRAKVGATTDPKDADRLRGQVPALLKDFIQRFPGSPRSDGFVQNLVLMLYKAGDLKGAEQSAIGLAQARTDLVAKRSATLFAVETCQHCHDDALAEKLLRDWISAHKDAAVDPDMVMRLADLLAETDRIAEGTKFVLDVAEHHAKETEFPTVLGMLTTYLVDNLEPDVARTMLEKYLKTAAVQTTARFVRMRLADVLAHSGHAPEAIKLAEQVRDELKDKTDEMELGTCTLLLATAHAALARTLSGAAAGAERAKAETLLRRVTGQNLEIRGPVPAQAMAVLEDVYLEGGQIDKAKALLAQAAKAYEGDPAGAMAQKDMADLELIGRPAVRIETKSADGRPFVLDDYAGKITVIDFWATWLQVSIDQMTSLKLMHRTLAKKGVRVISVSTDREGLGPSIVGFAADSRLDWPQLYDGRGFESPSCTAYGVKTIPQTILIGPDGKIARAGLGGTHLLDVVRQMVDALPGAGRPH